MDQDIERRADTTVGGVDHEVDKVADHGVDHDDDHDARQRHDTRITRRVHVVLGLVIAVLGAWLLYRSRTELSSVARTTSLGPATFPCC